MGASRIAGVLARPHYASCNPADVLSASVPCRAPASVRRSDENPRQRRRQHRRSRARSRLELTQTRPVPRFGARWAAPRSKITGPEPPGRCSISRDRRRRPGSRKPSRRAPEQQKVGTAATATPRTNPTGPRIWTRPPRTLPLRTTASVSPPKAPMPKNPSRPRRPARSIRPAAPDHPSKQAAGRSRRRSTPWRRFPRPAARSTSRDRDRSTTCRWGSRACTGVPWSAARWSAPVRRTRRSAPAASSRGAIIAPAAVQRRIVP